MKRSIIIFFTYAFIFAVSGCDSSNTGKAHTIPTLGNPEFIIGLDAITGPSRILMCISYWNGWQAVVRNRDSLDTSDYDAYLWTGTGFEKDRDSFIIRTIAQNKTIYDSFEPLGDLYKAHLFDYAQAKQVLDKNWWKIRDKFLYEIVAPSLMAIQRDGRMRPVWIFPAALWFHSGYAAMFADTGAITTVEFELARNAIHVK